MIKYVKQPDSSYATFDESSETYQLLNALDDARRPTFLDESDAGVQAYLASLVAQANVAKVTARQAKKALILQNKRDAVLIAIAQIPDTQTRNIYQNEYDSSNDWYIDNPVVQALATMLGWTPSELQDMFNYAKGL